MKLLAYTVYDEKAETFGHPFFVSTEGVALRMLQTWSNNTQSLINQHPEDFTLYQCGYWLDNEAKFDSLAQPKFIAKANQVTKPIDQQLKEVSS